MDDDVLILYGDVADIELHKEWVDRVLQHFKKVLLQEEGFSNWGVRGGLTGRWRPTNWRTELIAIYFFCKITELQF